MKKEMFVFSSVGCDQDDAYKHKVYRSWELEHYDSGCVRYRDADKFNYSKYFKSILYNRNYKFLNFIWYNKHANILDNYEFIAMMDDDLYLNNDKTFINAIDYIHKYNLDILSLSNDMSGKASWYNIMNTPKPIKEIWITNFCEMGAIIISSEICKAIIQTYIEQKISIVDFGFDLLFSKIANEKNKTIAIAKNLTYHNPPIIKPRYTGRNLFEQNKHKITNPLKSHEGKIKKVIHL